MGKQKNQSKLSKVKENVKSNLVESLELPMDIMYGAVIITAMGRNQILVENYKGIIEYTQEKIRLQTKTCQVTIQGKRLIVEYYTNEEMKITGYIQGIIYGS
ncbi:YabP/YqfC family sporulation protein [Lachnospiraceae bacterium JLR.KK009]|jgi:sporulation protein YqfC|nr:sporulation protein [Lachnospiraceae bacterium]MCI8883333.1 sporulation protein [Lachnospiraceae bacterium]